MYAMKYSNWKNSTYGDNDDNIYVPSKICKGVLIYIEKGDDDDEYVFVRIACLFLVCTLTLCKSGVLIIDPW